MEKALYQMQYIIIIIIIAMDECILICAESWVSEIFPILSEDKNNFSNETGFFIKLLPSHESMVNINSECEHATMESKFCDKN